jgi:hypothetical protein
MERTLKCEQKATGPKTTVPEKTTTQPLALPYPRFARRHASLPVAIHEAGPPQGQRLCAVSSCISGLAQFCCQTHLLPSPAGSAECLQPPARDREAPQRSSLAQEQEGTLGAASPRSRRC